jgi:hypothetical protein
MNPPHDASAAGHVRLWVLWAYSRDNDLIVSDDWTHLLTCETCTALLQLCRGSNSLKEVQAWLADNGITF